jgi:two-component system sensor histidine kinase/response regulator
MHKAPLVLVVDDQPVNIQLLKHKLERDANVRIETAENGQECLDMVSKHLPDLILLDVMMPVMDGIETCKRLKADPRTEGIPIIFITARTSKEGKLEGLGAGAVDYITKPLDLDETLARVNTQLRIQAIHQENIELHERLADARRTASVGAVTQGIAHNLNNLLGVVVGYLDLIKGGYDSKERLQRSVLLMEKSVNRMVKIVRELSSIADNDRFEMSMVSAKQLVGQAIERFRKEHGIVSNIHWDNALDTGLEISVNQERLETIIIKILLNAWEAYDRETVDEKKDIFVSTRVMEEKGANYFLIEIADEGTGIAPSIADQLFDPFVTTKMTVGCGLGLATSRHEMQNMGGNLRLENRSEKGAVAKLLYPL